MEKIGATINICEASHACQPITLLGWCTVIVSNHVNQSHCLVGARLFLQSCQPITLLGWCTVIVPRISTNHIDRLVHGYCSTHVNQSHCLVGARLLYHASQPITLLGWCTVIVSRISANRIAWLVHGCPTSRCMVNGRHWSCYLSARSSRCCPIANTL